VYAQREAPTAELFVNLFVGSEASVTVGGRAVRLTQQTGYPWRGDVTVRVDPDRPADFTLAVRIPGWSRGEPVPSALYRHASQTTDAPSITLNGTRVPLAIDHGFVHLRRRWQKGDVVALALPMPIRRVLAHDAVAEDRGKAVIERGPLVYCLEAVDNGGTTTGITLPLDARLDHAFRPSVLGGVEVITGPSVTAIPYFAWANRGRGEMAVWLPYR